MQKRKGIQRKVCKKRGLQGMQKKFAKMKRYAKKGEVYVRDMQKRYAKKVCKKERRAVLCMVCDARYICKKKKRYAQRKVCQKKLCEVSKKIRKKV
jgi:hypothetical protein